MKKILTIILVAFATYSCSDSDAPIVSGGGASTGTIEMTVSVDTCIGFDSLSIIPVSGSVDTLCGESSQVVVTFELVEPSFTYESEFQGRFFQYRKLVTGPASWTFANPVFEEQLANRLAGLSLEVTVFDMNDGLSQRIGIWVHAPGMPEIMLNCDGDLDLEVDSDGFPILANLIEFDGQFLVTFKESILIGNSGQGNADVRLSGIENP
jgi:hypothetical protein